MNIKCLVQRSMKRSRQSIRSSVSNETLSQASFDSHSRTSSMNPILTGEPFKSIALRGRRCFHTTKDDNEMATNGQVDSRSLELGCEDRGIRESLAMPPPPPEPVYSVHMRVLPSSLLAMSSSTGRKYLLESLKSDSADSFWILVEQFLNQSEPAYCGVTTLVMVLNALSVDPGVRWRGGWRYYGNEDVLLDRCCFETERVRRVGINMEEFRVLGKCHGLGVEMKRPSQQFSNGGEYNLESLRDDLRATMIGNTSNSVLVVSFSRSHLNQTGEGHFSPVAAYHEETDQALILDVARFKYPPYWVSLDSLYNAMIPIDKSTNKSRGWFLLHPPKAGKHKDVEARRPAELVPELGEQDLCPIGQVKRAYCKANRDRATQCSHPSSFDGD